jgi:hypothetical protein
MSNDHDSGDEKYNRISMRTKRDRSVYPPCMLAVRQEGSICSPLSRAKRKHEMLRVFESWVGCFSLGKITHCQIESRAGCGNCREKRQGKDAVQCR